MPVLFEGRSPVLALAVAARIDERLELLVRHLVFVDQVVAGRKLQSVVEPGQIQRERSLAYKHRVCWDRSARRQSRKRAGRRARHFDRIESILLEFPAEHATRDPDVVERRASEMLPRRCGRRVRLQVHLHAIGDRGNRSVNGDPLLETRQPQVLRRKALDRLQTRERCDVFVGIGQPRGFCDERVNLPFIAAALHEPHDRGGGRHQCHDRRRHDDSAEYRGRR